MSVAIPSADNSLDSLLERLPLDSNERGKSFEKATKWFLQKDPTFASQISHVWLWDEWPDRDGRDLGIDLVAKTYDGKLWAIQSKCYTGRVPTDEIDSFISASAQSQFSHRLLISTGPISGNAEYKLKHQEKSTAFLLRHNLKDSAVNWLAFLDHSRPALPDKKTPRDHQKAAIDDVINGFSSNDKGRLIMACGTGKTLVALWISEKLETSRTLVLVPSLSLLDQVSKEWLTNSNELLNPLFVCSDQTVGDDVFISNTGELGNPPTTNPDDIHQFLSGPGRRVIFSTYQSSPQISEAQALGAPAFDLVVADEAHHCAGKLDSAFATVLDADILKANKRLFMTATPRNVTRRRRDAAAQSDVQVTSMDDLDLFGPEMHVLTFGRAIEDGLLSDYQVLILGITDSEIKELALHRRFVELFGPDFSTDAENLAHLVGVIKAIRKYDLQYVLTFHNRIVRAKNFVDSIESLNEILPTEEGVGHLWSKHISGDMTSRQRNQILENFKSGEGRTNLLSNARCLGEGIDIPGIDGVGFIDPKRSIVDIAQAVGRAIRKSDLEKIGTIILPVLIDENSDLSPEEQVKGSRFETAWYVLNALRAHDEVLAEELDTLRYGLGRHGRVVGRIPGKIVIEVPTVVGIEFIRAIETEIVLTTTESWEFWFGLLEKFVDREKHARVARKHIEEGNRLGYWCNWQRYTHRIGTMQIERAERLEALPNWHWDPYDADWEMGFEYLQMFVDREGHCLVPQGHEESNYKLGSWVSGQRTSFQSKKISEEHKTRLESLPSWEWDAREAFWVMHFNALRLFSEQEGHTTITDKAIVNGLRLGQWIGTVKRSYRDGQVSAGRVDQLSSLPGWTWDRNSVPDMGWNAALDAVKQFWEREGHLKIPRNHFENGIRCGGWITKQRDAYRRGKLSNSRYKLLSAIPGWEWEPNASLETIWDGHFSALLGFANREGHSRVPPRFVEEDLRLGQWVGVQRTLYKNGKLPENRVQRLETVPNWSWNLNTTRTDNYRTVIDLFVQREGHARIPRNHIENGTKLGQWAGIQRSNYKKGILSEDDISYFEQLAEWAWDVAYYDGKWDQGFSELLEFVKVNGHSLVPTSHIQGKYRLGSWITAQRSKRSRGLLAADRIEKLETLPGWAWSKHEHLWQVGLQHMKLFVEREGHARVPQIHIENNFALGHWAHNLKRRGTTPERRGMLDDLPGWIGFNPRNTS